MSIATRNKLMQLFGALLMAAGVTSCTLKDHENMTFFFLVGVSLYTWGRLSQWFKK